VTFSREGVKLVTIVLMVFLEFENLALHVDCDFAATSRRGNSRRHLAMFRTGR